MNILRSDVATANTKPQWCAAEISTLSCSWQLIIIDWLVNVKRRPRLDHVHNIIKGGALLLTLKLRKWLFERRGNIQLNTGDNWIRQTERKGNTQTPLHRETHIHTQTVNYDTETKSLGVNLEAQLVVSDVRIQDRDSWEWGAAPCLMKRKWRVWAQD